MTDLKNDTAPTSGRSSGDSGSPLSARRGNADPTDIHPDPVTAKTGDFGYYENPRQPLPPIEPGGALPPQEPPKTPGGK
jgi:hypothetical protein